MLPHITVIIAHRHLYFRTILQNILQAQSGLCVLAVVSTMVELLEQAMLHTPDIILADIGFTGMDGLSLLAPLAAIGKPPKFIFSWQYYEVPLLRALIATAPASYIVHDAPPSEYNIAIRQVIKGLPYCCPQTERLLNSTNMLPFDVDSMFEFNQKYQLLFYCEDLGYKGKEIALGISLTEATVRTYQMEYRKLLGSRSKMVKEHVSKKKP
jgi:DNA-binding NarL/FixJ family response regulator